MIPSLNTRTGARMKRLGLGTWRMGEDSSKRSEEVRALRAGMDLGITLLDTAEMYASGGAEEVVAEAIAGRRDEVFVVSKVLPSNASREGTLRAAERSLRRLRTDRIDLYLLHWDGPHPLAGTIEAFMRLRDEGKILHYGVSNFDTPDMEAAEALPGGGGIASNQVLYNLRRRGIERKLLPWCAERGVVVMAYSPFDQGMLPWGGALAEVARRRGVTQGQAALAWILGKEGVIAIPKASKLSHVEENAAAIDVVLTKEDLSDLDAAFPAPDRDIPLETA